MRNITKAFGVFFNDRCVDKFLTQNQPEFRNISAINIPQYVPVAFPKAPTKIPGKVKSVRSKLRESAIADAEPPTFACEAIEMMSQSCLNNAPKP